MFCAERISHRRGARTGLVGRAAQLPAVLRVTAIAALPSVLENAGPSRGAVILSTFATDVMRQLGQAALIYQAFAQMRGRRVSLVRSVQLGLRRFLAVVGLAIAVSLLIGAGTLLLLVPGIVA